MTPADLITLALKDAGVVGVGQTPLAEDVTDAFTKLNMMMGQWSRRRWLIYHLVDVPFTATGATSYTIGSGGVFNVTRPDTIENAYVRLLTSANPADRGLTIIQSREDYDRIALKSLVGFPQAVFLDSDYPLGTVYIWPIPPGGGLYEIHLVLKAELPSFANLTADINLPPEYQEALLYNLVGRLCIAYDKPIPPGVVALARAALNTVRNANAQIPVLEMPPELRGPGKFNIYSGDYR